MAWVRVDDKFDDNAEIDAMPVAGIALYFCALTWSSRLGTDGFIPAARVKKLPGGDSAEAVEALVSGDKPWWVPVDGGYQVRSFLKYNPSAAEVEDKRQTYKERAGKGAEARWHKKEQALTTDPNEDATKHANKDAVKDASGMLRIPYPVSQTPEPGVPLPLGGVEGCSKTSKRKKSKGRESSLDWARFLAAYPARAGGQNRAEGERKFERLIEAGEDIEAMVNGAERFAAFLKASGKVGTEFVPMMTTWLNQRRWTDDYGAPQPQGGTIMSKAQSLLDGIVNGT